MEWTGKWIWIKGDPNPINYWLCARKSLDLDSVPTSARLHITADTRYVAWINGERLGQGPVRSWPFAWRYDTYDLRGMLKPGPNMITVLVIHYGVGTFQSLPTRGGLLAQLEADGQVIAATDSSWKLHHHPGYSRRAFRISCQQGFVEQYDAFREQAAWHHAAPDQPLYGNGPLHDAPILSWQRVEFDDSDWPNALELGPAGRTPWTRVLPRDVPYMTEDPIYPVDVLRARTVRTPDTIWALSLRNNLLPGYRESNTRAICGMVALRPMVRERTHVKLRTHQDISGQLRVNGRDIERVRNLPPPWDQGYTWEFVLERRENLLLFDVTGNYHEWASAYVVEAEPEIPEYAAGDGWAPFATFGPFESREDPAFQGVWNSCNRPDLEEFEAYRQPIAERHQVRDHVFLRVACAQEVARVDRRSFQSLAAHGAAWTDIPPSPDGDTEILLDFGRMTAGLWEFEVDCEEGVHLDLVGVESMQDGTLDFTWGVNVAMSYITCRGRQAYRSVVRRGCRYLLLTIRENREPLRIRSLRTLLNTYPVVERGAFQCSDDRLNNIWKMGQYTARLCSEDTYVDCPTYEQTFWVGDARNEGAINHYAFGEYALSRRSLLLAADSLARSPIVESQVPSSWQDLLTTWSLLWVIACEEYYQVSGDLEFVRAIYPAIARQSDYLLRHRDDRGLIHFNAWNLLDWAPLDTHRDSACAHIQAWTVMALERQIRLASAIGHTEGVPTLSQAAREIAYALNKWLWDERRQAYRDSIHADGSASNVFSQGTNTVIVLAGCAPPERELAIRRLVSEAPPGLVRVGSPFFMFFTFEALARMGEFERILDLSRFYWGIMLDRGATTCWETFPGWEPGGRWTRSHCHAWSAAPTYFLSRYQLGVSPLEPGFKRASIAPMPAGLQWAKGRVPTPHGEISVEWHSDPNQFTLDAELPPNVPAVIQLPVPRADFHRVTHSGVSAMAADDYPMYLADPGARVHIEAGRGW